MTDSIKFDFSEVLALAADLGKVPDKAGPLIRKAVEVTARNVKEAWKEPLKSSRRVPGGARTISYDLKVRPGVNVSSLSAEVGPTVRGEGSHWVGGLVGALEMGSLAAAPTGYGAKALQDNQADFQKGLEIALGQAERAVGL